MQRMKYIYIYIYVYIYISSWPPYGPRYLWLMDSNAYVLEGTVDTAEDVAGNVGKTMKVKAMMNMVINSD